MMIRASGRWAGVAVAALSMLQVGAQPQSDNFIKNFKVVRDLSTGVDFYVGSQTDAVPFKKPIADARARLSTLLGSELTAGAVVICSTLEQKDAVSEARILRMGYRWLLIELTPEATAQQLIARIKSESGGEVPPGLLERLQNRTPEMKAASEARLVSSVVQRMAYATISTTLAPDKPFRSSRVDDMTRSPLPDWMDIGLASYAAGGQGLGIRFLKERIDEAFPLEDVLTMSRPFVAPSSGGGGGQAVFIQGGHGGGPGGAGRVEMPFPGPGSAGGGSGRGHGGGMNLPKDAQDRMMFDAEAASFFSFLVAKAGIDKVKAIVEQSREAKNSLDVVTQSGLVDKDLEKVEQEWQAWLKEQNADDPPGSFRMTIGPESPPAPPR